MNLIFVYISYTEFQLHIRLKPKRPLLSETLIIQERAKQTDCRFEYVKFLLFLHDERLTKHMKTSRTLHVIQLAFLTSDLNVP